MQDGGAESGKLEFTPKGGAQPALTEPLPAQGHGGPGSGVPTALC